MAVVSCIGCNTRLGLFVMSLLVVQIQQVGSVGVALYKPTNQSGVYNNYYANLAVDGNIQTCAEPLNDTPGSNQNLQCWWMVDLSDLYTVHSVTIYNVASGNSNGISYQYLASFTILVGASTDINFQSTCYTFYGMVSDGGNQTFTCSSLLFGRYVSIQKFASSSDPLSRPDTIVLCEVDVAATDFDDVALQKSTNQSGTYLNFYSSGAVDGNIHSCAQPLAGNGDQKTLCWWQVDLGGYYTISSVTIFNVGPGSNPSTGDNHSQFLTSFNIWVGNSTDNVDSQFLCYTFTGTVPNGGNQTFLCSPVPTGRYVTIKKFASSDTRPDTMILCEVIVTGTPTSSGTSMLQTTIPPIITTPTTTTRGFSQPTVSTAAQLSTTKIGQSSSGGTTLQTSGGQLGSPTSGSTIASTPESNTTSINNSPSNNNSASNETTCKYDGAEIAAIIMGVLFGITLVFTAVLICYIIKQRQQIQILTTEKIKTLTKENQNYEQLHRDVTSSRPANSREQDASPYEELNIVDSTVSTRA